MATKVYAISGKSTVQLQIPVGKAVMPITFDKGYTSKRNFRPATFSTNKKYVQDIIENSPYFGSLIKLFKEYGNDNPDVKPDKRRSSRQTAKVENEKTEAPEITTQEKAAAYLKAHGAKATDLVDVDAMKKYAEKIGVSFPNLNI